ncbi:hypothetical protein [Okeania sp. SIO2B3]|uniref:hypothetical protein n=1 Tax=Okeania sp. SIO2B3 TaxID=2607784 RepID=UPI0013BEBE27|nr:hypothetical protein [Okeania sp. SIO2B3]NET44848.1 hypothetical protein [Okeania sp. SIO2B3]
MNKLIWYGSLTVLSANLTVFVSYLAIQFSALRIVYILLVIAIGWFFKSQFSEGFRQAFADSLGIDEGEFIMILFCLLIGALVGGAGTWINQVL